jgi:hypothetical protein
MEMALVFASPANPHREAKASAGPAELETVLTARAGTPERLAALHVTYAGAKGERVMIEPTPRPSVQPTSQGRMPSRNGIMDALAGEGCSADEHEARLKAALTRLAADGAGNPGRERIAQEVETIFDEQVQGKPIADDTL